MMRIFTKPQDDHFSINMLLSAMSPVLLSIIKIPQVKQLQGNIYDLNVKIIVGKT